MQYREGTVEVQNGLNTICGRGTSWIGRVTVGDLFKLRGMNCSFPITAVTTNNELEIGVNWPFASAVGRQYQIQSAIGDLMTSGDVDDLSLIYLSKADGYAFADLGSYCTLSLYNHKRLVLYYEGLQGYIKVVPELLDPVDPTGLRYSAIIDSGTLIAGALYLVVTEDGTDPFPVGVDEYFNAAGTEVCDANNTVKQVIAPSENGAFIVNTPDGDVYNWISL